MKERILKIIDTIFTISNNFNLIIGTIIMALGAFLIFFKIEVIKYYVIVLGALTILFSICSLTKKSIILNFKIKLYLCFFRILFGVFLILNALFFAHWMLRSLTTLLIVIGLILLYIVKKKYKNTPYLLLEYLTPLLMIAIGILLIVYMSTNSNTFIVVGALTFLVGIIRIVIWSLRNDVERKI